MIIFWTVWFGALLLILIFGAVLLVGAPYLPTQKKRCSQALKLMDLKKGQTLFDLGCGDGVMLRMAAEQGLNAVGYEINPILAAIAWARTRCYGRQVKVRYGNFWRADLNQADGVFVFLLDKFMSQLDKKLIAEGKSGVKLVSHAFKIPGRQYAKKSGPFFLYPYP